MHRGRKINWPHTVNDAEGYHARNSQQLSTQMAEQCHTITNLQIFADFGRDKR